MSPDEIQAFAAFSELHPLRHRFVDAFHFLAIELGRTPSPEEVQQFLGDWYKAHNMALYVQQVESFALVFACLWIDK